MGLKTLAQLVLSFSFLASAADFQPETMRFTHGNVSLMISPELCELLLLSKRAANLVLLHPRNVLSDPAKRADKARSLKEALKELNKTEWAFIKEQEKNHFRSMEGLDRWYKQVLEAHRRAFRAHVKKDLKELKIANAELNRVIDAKAAPKVHNIYWLSRIAFDELSARIHFELSKLESSEISGEEAAEHRAKYQHDLELAEMMREYDLPLDGYHQLSLNHATNSHRLPKNGTTLPNELNPSSESVSLDRIKSEHPNAVNAYVIEKVDYYVVVVYESAESPRRKAIFMGPKNEMKQVTPVETDMMMDGGTGVLKFSNGGELQIPPREAKAMIRFSPWEGASHLVVQPEN